MYLFAQEFFRHVYVLAPSALGVFGATYSYIITQMSEVEAVDAEEIVEFVGNQLSLTYESAVSARQEATKTVTVAKAALMQWIEQMNRLAVGGGNRRYCVEAREYDERTDIPFRALHFPEASDLGDDTRRLIGELNLTEDQLNTLLEIQRSTAKKHRELKLAVQGQAAPVTPNSYRPSDKIVKEYSTLLGAPPPAKKIKLTHATQPGDGATYTAPPS